MLNTKEKEMEKIFYVTKRTFFATILFLFLSGSFVNAIAGDSPFDAPLTTDRLAMPALSPGEFGTDIDNEDNSLSGNPDGDMDTYLFNTNSIHPVEFNIVIPSNPGSAGATLRMDVYDIDSPAEVDEVYLNGVYLGTLNGTSNTWGVNIFTIPSGTMVQGNNLVEIKIDINNSGSWAATIDWGIISGLQSSLAITRAWVSPVVVTAGQPVNFFAEVSGDATSVEVHYGGLLTTLTDPDEDGVWSGSYTIPGTVPTGFYWLLKMRATDGTINAFWPGLGVIQPQ